MPTINQPTSVDHEPDSGNQPSLDNRPTSIPPNLVRLSRLMDSAIRLPGGYRIGWDGIIGLIPGLGDAIGLCVSLYIIYQARAIGASNVVIGRMLLNVGLESAVGTIPLVGDLFDFAFKANNRNLQLVQQQVEAPSVTDRKSKLTFIVIFVSALIIIGLIIATVFKLIGMFLGWIF